MPNNSNSSLTRIFDNLNVRPKLIVLHNLFFLVLTCATYFTLIPLFEQQVGQVEVNKGRPAAIPPIGDPHSTDPEAILSRAKTTLFIVLGIVYVLAVLLLETFIMPRYVYRPLSRMLRADQATLAGNRERELIPPMEIMGDEIGQIMRSRNSTVEVLRRQEDELAVALRKLEEQDRLVSLGLLSASVAHELNTPLAVLNGSLEKLIETTEDAHTLERLHRMQRVTKRLRTISESLVDFAKVRHQQTEPVGVKALVEEAWALVAIDERAQTVAFTNQVHDERVMGNSDRLVQVFVNLLRNALHAVEAPGGRIEARARRQDRLGTHGVAITVEDNGHGIPAAVLPNVFDAFVTTRLDAQGTGLGLTVAEGIVTQHGGAISVANRKEGGASLEVWLPAPRG